MKELLEHVRIEDNLPSNAGNCFRDILRYDDMGWRELDLVRQWLTIYLDTLTFEERLEVVEKLTAGE